MKIAFIWYFDKASWVFPNWRDGYRAAIGEISKKHEVEWFLDKKLPEPGEFDFLLFWSSSSEDYFQLLDQYTERKGICLTTDPSNVDNLRKMNIVFVESQPVYQQCVVARLPVIKAFGTDSDFFKPKDVEKDIEYFYPATFSPWKKQSEIAHLGDKLLCVGTLQPDGGDEFRACKEKHVNTAVGYFPAEQILGYYQRAKNVIIPAIHGSERTVLEAMSCEILPIVNEHNRKAYSYVQEYKMSGFKTPREFILNRYSAKIFAENLLKGII